ncbi:hypothetical protein FB451DRAFT_1205909 [Mycena latifolia]|nr:hypothetical protein FB451DRAFT_1205909 [Mycena latifolia]
MKLSSSLVTLSVVLSAFAAPTPGNPLHQCDKKRSLAKRSCDINACVAKLASLSSECVSPWAVVLGPLDIRATSGCFFATNQLVTGANSCAGCVSLTYDPVSWDWNFMTDADSNGNGATDGGNVVGPGDEDPPDPNPDDPDDPGQEC